MSRLFFILSLPHPGQSGKPSLGFQSRIAENDMYGAFSLNSLSPAARAEHARTKGPTQDRFGFQIRSYHSSTSLAFIVNTSQHVPYVCWSSDAGPDGDKEALFRDFHDEKGGSDTGSEGGGHRKKRRKHRRRHHHREHDYDDMGFGEQ